MYVHSIMHSIVGMIQNFLSCTKRKGHSRSQRTKMVIELNIFSDVIFVKLKLLPVCVCLSVCIITE